jgi:hypothetical protein
MRPGADEAGSSHPKVAIRSLRGREKTLLGATFGGFCPSR